MYNYKTDFKSSTKNPLSDYRYSVRVRSYSTIRARWTMPQGYSEVGKYYVQLSYANSNKAPPHIQVQSSTIFSMPSYQLTVKTLTKTLLLQLQINWHRYSHEYDIYCRSSDIHHRIHNIYLSCNTFHTHGISYMYSKLSVPNCHNDVFVRVAFLFFFIGGVLVYIHHGTLASYRTEIKTLMVYLRYNNIVVSHRYML